MKMCVLCTYNNANKSTTSMRGLGIFKQDKQESSSSYFTTRMLLLLALAASYILLC